MAIGGAARRTALAGLAAVSGGRASDLLWGRDRLTVLVYHRIGDPSEPGMEFDPGVFSATPEMFARQMRWVASNFNVVSVDDLVAHLDGGPRLPDRPLLITFDDGYRDNHEVAFPVLRDLNLPAVIFLATGAIGTDRVMWWDELPYLLGRTGRTGAELPLVGPRALHDAAARLSARRELVAALKAVPDDARARAMGELRDVLGVAAPVPAQPLFMDWDAVAELVAGGVDCQPHTVDHPILIRVDGDRARREIRESAEAVRRRTGRPQVAFAYPNGDWSADTMAALTECGIRLGFTMRLGPCRASDWPAAPLEIPRVPLDATDSWDLFRLKATGAASSVLGAMGRRPPARLAAA
ncbi:MAG: polysaccharide deacetylase family protein [Thermoleophilia bacterium]